MPTFAYTALNRQGKRTAGRLDADDRGAALSSIESLGLVPVDVTAAMGGHQGGAKPQAGAPSVRRPGRARVKQKHVLSFVRQMGNLLGAGVPLARVANHGSAERPGWRLDGNRLLPRDDYLSGDLWARMTRLDALGEHITAMAKLDGGEFDFSQPPALGGPIGSEFNVDFQEFDDAKRLWLSWASLRLDCFDFDSAQSPLTEVRVELKSKLNMRG